MFERGGRGEGTRSEWESGRRNRGEYVGGGKVCENGKCGVLVMGNTFGRARNNDEGRDREEM